VLEKAWEEGQIDTVGFVEFGARPALHRFFEEDAPAGFHQTHRGSSNVVVATVDLTSSLTISRFVSLWEMTLRFTLASVVEGAFVVMSSRLAAGYNCSHASVS